MLYFSSLRTFIEIIVSNVHAIASCRCNSYFKCSTRQLEREDGINKTSIFRILHEKFHPFFCKSIKRVLILLYEYLINVSIALDTHVLNTYQYSLKIYKLVLIESIPLLTNSFGLSSIYPLLYGPKRSHRN